MVDLGGDACGLAQTEPDAVGNDFPREEHSAGIAGGGPSF